MANTTETATFNVKSNIGEVGKDANNASGDLRIMGLSLNGVKKGFASAAVTAKGMFGSVKAGLISTGIGAFLVIIGSLFMYFTKTKRGAEMLEVALAGVGAVMDVLTDLFSTAGEAMVKAFEDPQQAVEDLWETMKDLLVNRMEGFVNMFTSQMKLVEAALSLDWDAAKEGAKEYGQALIQMSTGMDVEMQNELVKGVEEFVEKTNAAAAAATRLMKIQHRLRDQERDFSIVRAQTRQDIQKARLDALDESKTAEERLKALQTANDLELQTTETSLEMQKKKIMVQKETMALSENMADDLDKLASLEVELINLQTQSFQTQKRLATEMETLTNEIAADKKAIEDQEWKDKIAKNDAWNLQQQADAKAEIVLAEKTAATKKLLSDKLESTKTATLKMGAKAAMKIAGEGSAIGKSVAVAMAIMNTKNAVTAALGATPYGPWNIAQAIATGVFGMTQVAGIISTPTPAGGGGGGGGGGAGGGIGAAPPTPQMMSGSFDISGAEAPEPIKAFVLTDEMSNSQNQLANIRRRATI